MIRDAEMSDVGQPIAAGKRAESLVGRRVAENESARREATLRRVLAVESEQWLDQADGFARGGDYLGAQARARFAEHRLVLDSSSLPENDAFVIATHAHLDLRIRHYDALVRQWQAEVEARHTAHVAREQQAIGGGNVTAR